MPKQPKQLVAATRKAHLDLDAWITARIEGTSAKKTIVAKASHSTATPAKLSSKALVEALRTAARGSTR